MTEGVCWLIGAGPGSAELLTMLGRDRLSAADVVLYDALVDPRMLDWARPDAELIPVGKRSGKASMKQKEINALLCERVARGDKVARLKGGDPFIFGRGGEEAEALAARGLRFETVPGVTAASAAAAYAGIPLTHRGVAASASLVTGREAPGSTTPPEWEALARSGGTICIYMGVEKAGTIARRLLDGGRAANEPVAIVQRAGYPDQRTRALDLGTLETFDEREVERPALILVGGVVGLRERLAWLERKPLYGKRIVVTRKRSGVFENMLEALGATVLSAPVFAIVEPEFRNNGGDRDELTAAVASFADPHGADRPDWLLFTSKHAVDSVWNRLRALSGDARWFGGVRIAAVGRGTAEALERHAVRADLTAEREDADGLARALLGHLKEAVAGKRFLHFAGDLSDGRLLRMLAESGGICRRATAYHNIPLDAADGGVRGLLEKRGADAIVFLSGSAVSAFDRLFDGFFAEWREGDGPVLACLGKTASDALRECGVFRFVEPEAPSLSELCDAIANALIKKLPQG